MLPVTARSLPARLPRPILVQLHNVRGDGRGVQFDRFRFIDSDFA
jgi:hypothetical protein